MRACICCKRHNIEECAKHVMALRNDGLRLGRCSFFDSLWWVSKLSGKCFPNLFILHSVRCDSPSPFLKSLLSPWVIWMESGRSAWDKLSMATSLTATLDPKPFKVFAWIPSISCILYVPFSGQLHLRASLPHDDQFLFNESPWLCSSVGQSRVVMRLVMGLIPAGAS